MRRPLFLASGAAFMSALAAFVGCSVETGRLDEGDDFSRDEEVGVVHAGLSKCAGGTNGQHDYCSSSCPCDALEGDCDTDAECTAGSVCGVNNGAKFGFDYTWDFCEAAHCFSGTLDADETGIDCGGTGCGACVCDTGAVGGGSYCTTSCPCSAGGGDCDSDAECESGLTCTPDVGAQYGQIATNDVCTLGSCTNGAQDGDETGTDCGGSCGVCASTTVEAATVSTAGVFGDARSFLFYGTSNDGRYVAFVSEASNLVAGDTNGVADVFVRDLVGGTTTRVSVASSGAQSNGASGFASISDDGRYVAFMSGGSNLVSGDSNGVNDVFIHDRTTRSTSRAGRGAQPDGASAYARISGNGRYVAYSSAATNLVSGDTNGATDVFLFDRIAGTTIRASQATGGVQADATSERPTVSDDGRYIAFQSAATNLVAGDTNAQLDVFVHDRVYRTTTIVSLDELGGPGNSASTFAVISGNGSTVAFRSNASDLVTGDTNRTWDIFVRPTLGGVTERVSVDSAGLQANGSSIEAWISDTGSRVVFSTSATNLGGDANGSTSDLYLRDRTAITTALVVSGDAATQQPVISGDGARVVARSDASGIVVGDTNGQPDIYSFPVP